MLGYNAKQCIQRTIVTNRRLDFFNRWERQIPIPCSVSHKFLKKTRPISRSVQISEILDALLYLQSASMVNGETICIDVGAHAGVK
jgi:NAD(P)-dependent dehydrogenase (short-subunit alcohol dehydrogenase family)